MSWFFAISKSHSSYPRDFKYIHDVAIFFVSFPGFYLALGGNPDTIFWESNSDSSSGWAVVGIGIKRDDLHAHIMSFTDWAKFLSEEVINVKSIDGHFAIIRWNVSSVECFTDQLGLRTIYFGMLKEGVCISTRLDWVARTTKCSQIDLNSFGGRWLMFNQLSYSSCVIGIERLGPGGYAKFDSGLVKKCNNSPWLPSFEPQSLDSVLEILKSFLVCVLDNKYKLSLGLSGGLDSRLLLSLLFSISPHGFVTHTFGPSDDPDVQLARNLSSALKLRHFCYNDRLPDIKTCLSNINSFIAQNMLVEPASSWVKLRYYPILRNENK